VFFSAVWLATVRIFTVRNAIRMRCFCPNCNLKCHNTSDFSTPARIKNRLAVMAAFSIA